MTNVNKVTTKISKSLRVMRRLGGQLPADVMVKLYYFLLYFYPMYAVLACGRSVRTNAPKIVCDHRRARKLLRDYN